LICPGRAIRQKPGFNSCHCNDGSSEGLVWQSLHAPAGPKRHTAVDTFGLGLWWSQQQVFLNVKRANRFFLSVYQMGQRVSRLYLIGVDRGDSGHQFLKWVMDCLGWMIQVVLRPQQTQGFVLEKKIGGCTNFWLAQLVSTVKQGRSINNPYITF